MLQLRPTCEHCDRPLPPASTQAMICSFECTFCRDCVQGVLAGTCPNCGGDFSPRPIRPARDWQGGNHLGAYPASTTRKHRPADLASHAALLDRLRGLPPHER